MFHHAANAVFVADRHRSRAVVESFLGDWHPDYWISDRYAGQMDWARSGHQVCLAHFIRAAQYVVDQGDAAFAPALIALLKDARAIGARRDRLADATLKTYDGQLNRRLDQLMRIKPTHPSGEKLQKVVRHPPRRPRHPCNPPHPRRRPAAYAHLTPRSPTQPTQGG